MQHTKVSKAEKLKWFLVLVRLLVPDHAINTNVEN